MTSIQLELTGASARARVDGLLTAGMVGVPVTISCDSQWDGLTKTLVCRSGVGKSVVLGVGEEASVAPEVLRWRADADNVLFLGVEGRSADGKLVMPSTMAYCGKILPGAEPQGERLGAREKPIWAQILRRIGDLTQLQTQRRSDLVAAINELLQRSSSGNTPIKGTDYFTEEDKQELVAAVLAALPAYQGEVTT